MKRIAVRYRGVALMPMKGSKAAKLIRSGEAKIRYNRKINEHYLVLLFEPTGFNTQDITLGADPGSTFDGFSIVSSKYHHSNTELIQRPKKGKNSIKAYKKRQADNRRPRRSRKWHRPIRFDNRTSKKLSPTIRANVEFRIWYIKHAIKMYPISKCAIEDVRYNHYAKSDGKSFSQVEQGKTKLYEFVESLGLKLELFEGHETQKLRINSFGSDPKVKDKGSKQFEAHCIDSFVLACDKAILADMDGNIQFGGPVILNNLKLNKKVTFIEKIVKVRRCLTRTRAKYKETKNYYKLKPGGIKEIYTKMGKRNRCRVKPEGVNSNHPKAWIYIENERAEKVKSNTARYGGTRINGKTFFKNNEWHNRIIS